MPTTPGTGLLQPATTTRTTATLCSPSSRVTDKEHVTLDEVFDAYYECRRRKRSKQSAVEYEIDYELNNYRLWKDLNDMTYKPGTSVVFCVTKPRLREVFAASFRDRIVHTLLVRRMNPFIEKRLSDCSCACRKGKGTLYAANRCREIMSRKPNGWIVSGDISGFFMSINKEILMPLWKDVIREACPEDCDWWMWLASTVIMHRPELNCVVHGDKNLWRYLPDNKTLFRTNGVGMPIGNWPSQISANLYMAAFDEFIERSIDDKMGYVKYADDFIIVSNDKPRLMKLINDSRRWLWENRRLRLHPRKISIQPVRHGTGFVGAFIKKGIMLPSPRLRNNAVRVADEWQKHPEHTESERRMLVSVWNSYAGLLRPFRSYRLRRAMWRRLGDYQGIYCVNMNKIVLTKKERKQK